MKLHLSAAALVILVQTALADVGYIVHVKNIGAFNNNADSGQSFNALAGDNWCGKVGCIGDGVVEVLSDSGELDLEAFPNRYDYAISVMCSDPRESVTSCYVDDCTNRATTNCDGGIYVQRDTTIDAGCTIVGKGLYTSEVVVIAKCE